MNTMHRVLSFIHGGIDAGFEVGQLYSGVICCQCSFVQA